ncbi:MULTISPECIES: RNA polymerase sigma factor [unclassified Kaistella]|uniref:RNA polymerase sigma factor n=1 Tax=unclassified Kaistella TaxID=2762626 RepID=UPI0027347613|nr:MULTISPECIES: sigma-70 family RNA polymerase sigma factor [unclassified Kaistella]MDP2454675.1 sigma-70 family RNA polymerase sigma factor [Kaistella sp. SH11-4b]MDP2457412.1 sigma-70 family RNA polymerase sigma factor [Kaistella sp. SH40-3]MDP2460172.1 sigma-70 family RNA polymerase sigma factor [Kaistella sp. SH19-2b]
MKNETISPDQLLSLLMNRDEKGFNYLYRNYSGALYGVIIRIVRYKEEANEVLQDVFVKIWNSIKSFDDKKASLYTWMLNIARNSAIDRLKSKSFQNDLQNQSIPDFVSDGVGLSTEQNHEFNEVGKMVNTLREGYRILINKAYFGGLTQEEIAEELQIPLGTVKTRTRAALLELKEILKEFKFIFLFFLLK